MAMLKTTCSYTKDSGRRRQRYSEKDGRALAKYVSGEIIDADDWGRQMDETRRLWGKNDGRTLYGFVISPDPRDRMSPDDLVDVAREWADANHPGYEYAIVVHDDNDNGVLHAHVYMNSVAVATGKKMHFTDHEVLHSAEALQKIARERGLHYFNSEKASVIDETHAKNDNAAQRAEREMMKRGATPWKQAMREAVDEAVRLSSS